MAAAGAWLAGCGGGSPAAPTADQAVTAPAASAKAKPAHRRSANGPKAAPARVRASGGGDTAPKATHVAAPVTHAPQTAARAPVAGSAPAPAPAQAQAPAHEGGQGSGTQAASSAALSVARASVDQVVLLHDLAVGATHHVGAPPGVGAPEAARLAARLLGAVRVLGAPAGSGQPAGASGLASALDGYAGLARQLAARPAAASTALSGGFVGTLRALDATWRPAVAAIGQANHVDLLSGMAPLLIPRSA